MVGSFVGSFVGSIADGANALDAYRSAANASSFSGFTVLFSHGIGVSLKEVELTSGKELLRAHGHGLANGALRKAQGGKFWHGYASGSISSLTSSYLQTNDFVGDLVVASVVGGASEAIAGGNFADGALTGAYVYLFNHLTEHNLGESIKIEMFETLHDARVRAGEVTSQYLAEDAMKRILILRTKKSFYLAYSDRNTENILEIPNIKIKTRRFMEESTFGVLVQRTEIKSIKFKGSKVLYAESTYFRYGEFKFNNPIPTYTRITSNFAMNTLIAQQLNLKFRPITIFH